MTNIALLPQIGVPNVDGNGNPDGTYSPASFWVATNGDWRDSIPFTQPSPNETLALNITGISFTATLRTAPGDPNPILVMSTENGLLVNGGASGVLSWAVPTDLPDDAPYYCTSRLIGYPSNLVMDILASGDGQTLNICQKAGPALVTVRIGIT